MVPGRSIMVILNRPLFIVQWLVTGIMLISGILNAGLGLFITRFKNRSLYITAIPCSRFDSAQCITPNFGFLLAGRMIQAAGSSVMAPLDECHVSELPAGETRYSDGRLWTCDDPRSGEIDLRSPDNLYQYYNWRLLFEMILPFAIPSLI